MKNPVLVLAGGVGGAKLALGLCSVLEPDELSIVVNTGDDDEFHGLHVSPDVDTVMYTLAGLSNSETGWDEQLVDDIHCLAVAAESLLDRAAVVRKLC